MPGAEHLPFKVSPPGLYDVRELYRGFDPARPASLAQVFDTRVYRWTRDAGGGKPRMLSVAETIGARLHDTAMDRRVARFLDPQSWVTVGFMGGHDVSRADAAYAAVARIARELRRRGFMIVTGGGPGLMEAANFGAFMAPFGDDALAAALGIMQAAPGYGADPAHDAEDRAAWLCAAGRARAHVLGTWDADAPDAGSSLGIPTWYYGAEPPNLFAAKVGKYFFNSLREDGLVSVANGGLVFGKGEAGTVQEVFQNANLNYYRDPGVHATPMVFLDRDFWGAGRGRAPHPGRKPVFPLVRALSREARRPFERMLLATDSEDEIVAFIAGCNGDRLGRVREADVRLRGPGEQVA